MCRTTQLIIQLEPLFSNRLSLKRLVKLTVKLFCITIILCLLSYKKRCGYTVDCKCGRVGEHDSYYSSLISINLEILILLIYSSYLLPSHLKHIPFSILRYSGNTPAPLHLVHGVKFNGSNSPFWFV